MDLEVEQKKRRKALLQAFATMSPHIVCVCGCEEQIGLTRVIGSLAKGRGPLYATDTCNKRMLRKG